MPEDRFSKDRADRPGSPRLRAVLVSWGVAWPAITVLLHFLEEPTRNWPLAMRTLLLTGLMVPAMVLVLIPALDRTITALERRHV